MLLTERAERLGVYATVVLLAVALALNVLSLLPAWSPQSGGSNSDGPAVSSPLSPFVMGSVHHFGVQGAVDGVPGTAHVFVRGLQSAVDPGKVTLRGFVHFERVALGDEWVGHNPEALSLQLVSAGGGEPDVREVRLPETKCLHTPGNWQQGEPLRSCLESTKRDPHRYPEFLLDVDRAGSYQLRLLGSNRSVSLDFVVDAAVPRQPLAGQPEVVHLLSPQFSVGPWLPTLLAAHRAHHARRGVARTLLYSRQQVPWEVEGVEMVPWPWAAHDGRPYLDQMLAYQHAILSLWGTPTLLLIIDLDEFLALPPGATAVQQQLAPGERCTLIPRYSTYSADNATFWAARDPVGTLTRRAQQPDHWKALIDPNYVFSFYVHEGAVCEHAAPCFEWRQCNLTDQLSVMHAASIMTSRPEPPTVPDESWQWRRS